MRRCKEWKLEELICKAISSDTTAGHSPKWQEAGHDDKADIIVRTNGTVHWLQVKSGKIDNQGWLVLSGYRLGRFSDDLEALTDYLNNTDADLIAMPYRRLEDRRGRHHSYQICYIPVEVLHGLTPEKWKRHGKQYRQVNDQGVEFSLRPSMSWQIWWRLPPVLIQKNRELEIT